MPQLHEAIARNCKWRIQDIYILGLNAHFGNFGCCTFILDLVNLLNYLARELEEKIRPEITFAAAAAVALACYEI